MLQQNNKFSFCILCEKCKDPIKEVIDELILYGYMLYHKKCWIKECEDYAKLSLVVNGAKTRNEKYGEIEI